MMQVINPYNQEIFAERTYEDARQVNDKIQMAREAQRIWHRTSLDERIAYVEAGLDYFQQHKAAIAREISGQMGKPLYEAHNEFNGFFERAEYMLGIARKTLAPENLPPKAGFVRRIEHEPLGVVLDIAAWNYPLLIAVNVVIPALLAGNTVLLKHSARTPLCGEHFEKAFGHQREGLVCNLVLTHEQTASLIREHKVDHAVFTGSVRGGRQAYEAVAHGLIDVGLELGGKDPAYIAADADLDFTVPNIVEGACYNAGQSCCAVERVYVHQSVYKRFVEQARQVMSQYVMGDPLDAQTTLGPLADRGALAFLERQVADARQREARVVMGGERLADTRGNFFPPTLLTDVPNEADVMQEESFGPLLPVQAVASDHEALERMNATRFGLTASVWTGDRERAEWFARELVAGTIYQNRCDYLDPALPWTGVGESGMGSSLSQYGFYHLTRRKSIHFRTQT